MFLSCYLRQLCFAFLICLLACIEEDSDSLASASLRKLSQTLSTVPLGLIFTNSL